MTSDSQGTGNYVGSLPSAVKLSMVDAALFFDGTLTVTSVPVGVQQFDPVVPVVTGISSLANWLRGNGPLRRARTRLPRVKSMPRPTA